MARLKKLADSTVKPSDAFDGFNYDIMPFTDSLAVTVSFGHSATVLFFAKPAVTEPAAPWQTHSMFDPVSFYRPSLSKEVVALAPAPDHAIRFLIITRWWGCAGLRYAIAYQAMQWQPDTKGDLKQIVSLKGTQNMDDDDDAINALADKPDDVVLKVLADESAMQTTDGRLILPYCEYSALDIYDRAELCAADIYDLSGNTVRYLETRAVHPALWALGHAIDYAQKPERQALLAYVADAALVDTLIHADLPTAGEDFAVEDRSDGSKKITMGWNDDNTPDQPPDAHYIMEQRNGNWIITAFDQVPAPAKPDTPH